MKRTSKRSCRIHGNRTVFIVEPHEHGNGGWCGSRVLARLSYAKALKANPVTAYLGGFYEPMFGSHIRICRTADVNDAVMLFDHDRYNDSRDKRDIRWMNA